MIQPLAGLIKMGGFRSGIQRICLNSQANRGQLLNNAAVVTWTRLKCKFEIIRGAIALRPYHPNRQNAS